MTLNDDAKIERGHEIGHLVIRLQYYISDTLKCMKIDESVSSGSLTFSHTSCSCHVHLYHSSQKHSLLR